MRNPSQQQEPQHPADDRCAGARVRRQLPFDEIGSIFWRYAFAPQKVSVISGVPPVRACLESALKDFHDFVFWVKAFNDNGAVSLMAQKPSTKAKLVTEICGSHAHAVEQVKLFGQDALGFSVKTIPYDCYTDIKSVQQSIGKEWLRSTMILLVIFVLAEIYAMVRYNHWKGYDWFHLPLQVTNKVSLCERKMTFGVSNASRLWFLSQKLAKRTMYRH